MTDTRQTEQKPSRTVLILTRAFQLFIVLCLLDGVLDLSMSAARSVKQWVLTDQLRAPAKIRPSAFGDIIKPMPALPMHYIPGAGNVSKKFSSEGISIDDLGMRSNGMAPPPHPRATAYLLGSSPAFGYIVPDRLTLSAHLERDLGNVRIMNFAGFPQTISQSAMRYHYVAERRGKPDFVLIAGATTDLVLDCLVKNANAGDNKTSAAGALFGKLVSRTKPGVFHCGSREVADQAIVHALYEIDAVIRYFKNEGVPLYIFMLPTPFDPGLNVENLKADRPFRENLTMMRQVYSLYREKLKSAHHPEIIDMSHVLPADKMYFVDIGGHMSGEAYQIIAAKIADYIEAAPPQPKH